MNIKVHEFQPVKRVSRRFKTILVIRFVGYLVFIIGLISFILVIEPVASAEIKYRLDQLRGIKRFVPNFVTAESTNSAQIGQPAGFGDIKLSQDAIVPVSTEFGIVIPKIDANAKVIPDVDPSREKEYMKALSEGVAHAKGTNFPGEKGNIYLFSHSTDAPWNVVRYNAVFYLLRELEPGDKVVMFYKNRRYDYIVFDKHIVGADEVSYLTNRYDQSVLTLQTCDPPGTTINRLIIRAKLVSS